MRKLIPFLPYLLPNIFTVYMYLYPLPPVQAPAAAIYAVRDA